MAFRRIAYVTRGDASRQAKASRLLDMEELQMSKLDLAKEAKAVYCIKRIVLVNTEIAEEYLEIFRDF